LEELERLLRFEVPEAKEVEAYIVRDPQGVIRARTVEKLEEINKGSSSETFQKKAEHAKT